MELSPDIRTLIEGLRRELAEMRAASATLMREVADLRRQLGKNRSNSSTPPSSDGFGKKPRIGATRCARSPNRTRSSAMKCSVAGIAGQT